MKNYLQVSLNRILWSWLHQHCHLKNFFHFLKTSYWINFSPVSLFLISKFHVQILIFIIRDTFLSCKVFTFYTFACNFFFFFWKMYTYEAIQTVYSECIVRKSIIFPKGDENLTVDKISKWEIVYPRYKSMLEF